MKLFRRGRKSEEQSPDSPTDDAVAAGESSTAAGVDTAVTAAGPAIPPPVAPVALEEAEAPSGSTASQPAPGTSVPEGAAVPEGAVPNTPERQNDGDATEIDAPSTGTPENEGFYGRLKRGLSRTGAQLASGLGKVFLGRKVIDDDLLEELEAQLLMSDVGVEATQRVLAAITDLVSRKELSDGEALMKATQSALYDIIEPCEQTLDVSGPAPFVILVVGVNGAGKTTTIGKLAHRYKAEGKRVMLAAGDTFRAAAVEQLQTWGERNDVPVIAQHTGADSASVLFDGLQAARSRGADVLIADTAGRLQNKAHLMDELEKVVRVMRKLEPTAPHETLLVLDAGTGQNAVSQAEQFDQSVGVTGIVLTKLDGTARGGVIFAIAEKLKRPIRFIGVGEGAGDLRPFEARRFVEALFDRQSG